MPVLKVLLAQSMGTLHSDTHSLQTNVESMHETPLLANEGKWESCSVASHNDNVLYRTWCYVDARFIKQYLIRREAIEERKLQEAGQAMKLQRVLQSEDRSTHS